MKSHVIKKVITLTIGASAPFILIVVFHSNFIQATYHDSEYVFETSTEVYEGEMEIEEYIEEEQIVEQKTEKPVFEESVVGYSESGRKIFGYKTGTGQTCMLFYATMHGRERGGRDLLESFYAEILNNPSMVHPSNTLILVPLVNPDGYYDRDDKLNANGVNINRNFQTSGWMQHETGESFAGEKPFSESESRAVKEIVDECDASVLIAFHSQGHLVSPEESNRSAKLGKWYANKTGYHYYEQWHYEGTVTRWFEETTENPAITVELTNHVDSDWEINKEALIELISKEFAF